MAPQMVCSSSKRNIDYSSVQMSTGIGFPAKISLIILTSYSVRDSAQRPNIYTRQNPNEPREQSEDSSNRAKVIKHVCSQKLI